MKRLLKKISINHLLLAGLVVGITLVAGSTVALLKVNSNLLTNKFAVASVESKIREDVSGENVAANTNIKKAVQIENTGKDAVFIRARIVVSPEKLWTDGKVSLKYGKWNGSIFTEEGALSTNPANLAQVDSSEIPGYWIYGNDGFYYFSELVPGTKDAALAAERFTDYLFGAVTLSSQMTSEDILDVTVYQESVVAKGYSNSVTDQKAAFAAVAANDNN